MINISRIYQDLLTLGLTRSKRDFSQNWLGRGRNYFRDLERRGSEAGLRRSREAAAHIATTLADIAAISPAPVAARINTIVAQIERDCRIADMLRR